MLSFPLPSISAHILCIQQLVFLKGLMVYSFTKALLGNMGQISHRPRSLTSVWMLLGFQKNHVSPSLHCPSSKQAESWRIFLRSGIHISIHSTFPQMGWEILIPRSQRRYFIDGNLGRITSSYKINFCEGLSSRVLRNKGEVLIFQLITHHFLQSCPLTLLWFRGRL